MNTSRNEAPMDLDESSDQERLIQDMSLALEQNRLSDFFSLMNCINPADATRVKYNFLKEALEKDNTTIAGLLMQDGCPVNFPDIIDDSPLHIAATRRTELFIDILHCGASVEAKNKDGETPLHLAFYNDPEMDDIVAHLLEYCVDMDIPNVINDYGMSFLHIACTTKMTNVVQYFINEDPANINLQISLEERFSYAGCTPLHFAVKNDAIEIAELLLRNGADIYAQNYFQSTPVHLAAERGNADMIEMLFYFDKHRRNPVNRYGFSHFMAACMCRHAIIVQDFLYTINPLHLQSSSTISSPASILVNSKVMNRRAYTFSGYTPLHVAAEYGRQEIVRILINYGASPYEYDLKHFRAIDLANSNNHADTVKLIAVMTKHLEIRRCNDNSNDTIE